MKEVIELLEGFGFSIDFEDEKQNKVRLQSEDTFIDVWNSRKGITVGLYNTETKNMKYARRVNCEILEKLISENK